MKCSRTEPSGCEAPELTSGTGSSPWMVHRGGPPSVLSEAAAAPEHHHNVPSYCPSLMRSTPETWNLDCWPTENDWKHEKKNPEISQKNFIKSGCNALTTVHKLTRAARSCSCSGPAHSQPWWSRSGSGAAPNDMYRHHLVWRAPQKMSAERKTVSDLLVVRVLNQLLGVFQFSYEVVLRRNMKRQNFKSVVPHISPAETDTFSPFPLRFLGLWSRSGLCFYPADLFHYSKPIAAQFQMMWKYPPTRNGYAPQCLKWPF